MKKKHFIISVSLMILLSVLMSCTEPAVPAVVTTDGTEPETTAAETGEATTEGETLPDIQPDTETETDSVTEPPEIPKRILINELMADNETFVMRCSDDWIELYNDEDEDVALAGFYLYKEKDREKRVALDGYTIAAKGFLVLKFDDESVFRLSNDGDCVKLAYKNDLIDEFRYDGSIGNSSIGPDGICEYATPGYPNTQSGYADYRAAYTPDGLYISEVMSSNNKYAPVNGSYYDLCEVYNGGTETVRLSNYYLSDKRSDLKRCKLPDVQLAPGQYYLIYCSGLVKSGHAPFKISSDGEELFLSDGEKITDYVSVPADLKKNESWGVYNGTFVYMDSPTPGKENKPGYIDVPAAPTSSVLSGAYDGLLTVALYGDGEIYYTTDGSEPTEKSTLYEGPIPVDGITSIRAVCRSGGRSSELASFIYILNAKHTYPVLNVAIKPEYLTGENGVLTKTTGKEYEYGCFVSLVDNGVELFSAPCGFKLHGNDSKKGAKQNFQLRFRSTYGLGTLDYPLFDNRDYTTFNSLLLHGGAEDYPYAGFRDELCTALVDGTTNLNTLAARPVVLYLNGEYRGIYWLRERFDTMYCANRLGVSRDSINLLNTYGSVSSGTADSYEALLSYVKKHSMKTEEYYKYVMDRIDAYSLMDWYICRAYFADRDLANVRFYQSTEDDGKWHWCFFDLDWSFYHNDQVAIAKTMPNNGRHNLIRSLLTNPDFKDMFLKRCAELMKTTLNEKRVLEVLSEYEAQFRTELAADRKLYNRSISGWESSVQKIRDFVKDGLRQKNFLASIKSFFDLSDAEMKAYFGDL